MQSETESRIHQRQQNACFGRWQGRISTRGCQSMSEQSYRFPDSIEEVKRILDRHGEEVTIVSGGQTLLPLVRDGTVELDHAVDISRIPALTRIERRAEKTVIGSAVTYRDILASEVGDRHSMLLETIEGIGDRQVRSLGTIGGALASGEPALDIIPVLYCLDATVVIGSSDGTRRVDVGALYRNATKETELRGPREDYIGLAPVEIDSSEIIEAIEIPATNDDGHHGEDYRKQTNVAGGWTISGVGTSVSLSPTRDRIDSARVGLAAVGQTGASAPTVETALEGTPTTMQEITKSVEQLGADIDPTTTFVTSQYRLQVTKTLTSRSIAEAVTRAGGELE
ncbi:hypothetical protein GRS80_01465 [Natrialba sp. INN-245]|nr:hypothetical protein [Natrialba sp. INN-245]